MLELGLILEILEIRGSAIAGFALSLLVLVLVTVLVLVLELRGSAIGEPSPSGEPGPEGPFYNHNSI